MPDPIVNVSQGKVLGKESTGVRGEKIFSFQGIPYAKPPIGDLRFKAPEPADKWAGTFDATKEGNSCYARHMVFKERIIGSEDCLNLNVYTPSLPSGSPDLKPVMVWIHGGAFTSGSNSADLYGPDFLVAEDVVLVTINYRLGILGFLNLSDQSLNVPGNAGLRDQILALKWVQENIKQFGGNPDNVTIFGNSAGAASLHYLVLSPLAKNLFHKAIAQSGTSLNIFARGRNVAKEIANILNFGSCNEKEILEHLKSLKIEELFELSEKVPRSVGPADLRPFGPVIEPKSEHALIADEPEKILNSGQYNKVPIMLGYTSAEGMLIEILLKSVGGFRHPKKYDDMVPLNLGIQNGSVEAKDAVEKIKAFYYTKDEDDINSFYLLHSDNYFIREIIYSARQHAATSNGPVYLYRMSVDSKLNIMKKLGKITNPGVCHGDELLYLFNSKLTPKIEKGSLEDISIRRFVTLWTNFAKYGDPNPKTPDDLIPVTWESVNPSQINFLDIDKTLVVGVDPEPERMAFWEQFFKRNVSP